MTRFLIQRLVETAVVLALMSFVVYALIGLMPGDPVDLMIASDPSLSPADAARLKAIYGLDRPIAERYLAWLGAALQGDFGFSRLTSRPVLEVLIPRLGNTLLLMGPEGGPNGSTDIMGTFLFRAAFGGSATSTNVNFGMSAAIGLCIAVIILPAALLLALRNVRRD